MSGHSKWSSIKHKKAAVDAKRGKIFTKLIREITIAAKLGGEDPEANPRLRSAVQSARSQNMPMDTVNRAISKGIGGGEGANYEEIIYEGFGPSSVAVVIQVLTDNRNRTVASIRSAFTKYNGNLGATNSVLHMFDRK
ncbi:MAG: YebC/PmpR family DNA-binding transcriptional regulator, partial [SAR324 cluster bacterium]|nr:YebC/PmpR family DNA-binding transcriptional regulator [SAR324 cluster bacterium]